MTFKNAWEKTDQRIEIKPQTIKSMVDQVFPKKDLLSHGIISGGCANLNIRVHLRGDLEPYILRVYLQDQEAAFKEQKLASLIKQNVPIPQVYYIGNEESQRFALIEYMPGLSLREVLLRDRDPLLIDGIMSQTGEMLERIQHYRFPNGGLLNPDLSVKPIESPYDSYLIYALECLKHPTMVGHLGETVIENLRLALLRNEMFFPSVEQNHLVHADYDPANILVENHSGKWQIAAILDWEFAYSGAWIVDVSNMLRYAHQMPPVYKAAFLSGMKNVGLILPDHWQKTVHMLNLMALLDSLARCPLEDRPIQTTDIRNLITYILIELDKES